jgi:hypothetical protein
MHHRDLYSRSRLPGCALAHGQQSPDLVAGHRPGRSALSAIARTSSEARQPFNVWGECDDPYLWRALAPGTAPRGDARPEAVLPTITETIARALKLPYVALTLAQEPDFTTAAAYGPLVENPLHVPLMYQNTQDGELILAPRGLCMMV